MARVRELAGRPIEQHNSPNRGGAMSDHRGVVLHIAQGTYRGTISWQMNPDQRYSDGTRVNTCSTWIVGRQWGEWAQMVDTDEIAWAQRAGSRTWLSIELAGWAPDGPTEWQVEACALLLAWSAAEHGHVIVRADHPGERGLGHHSMDREWLGEQWGHDQCPGAGVIAAKDAIVARAKQIEEDDMPSVDEIVDGVYGRTWPDYVSRKSATLPAQVFRTRQDAYHIRRAVLELLAGQQALLARHAGEDVAATVRAELDRAAEQERVERQAELGELAEALERASAERAELAELIRRGQSGEVTAEEVVRLIGERLSAAVEAPGGNEGGE